MILRSYEIIGARGETTDVHDLIEAAEALEKILELDEGSVIRELTALLERRRRFEGLRRDHDVRRH